MAPGAQKLSREDFQKIVASSAFAQFNSPSTQRNVSFADSGLRSVLGSSTQRRKAAKAQKIDCRTAEMNIQRSEFVFLILEFDFET